MFSLLITRTLHATSRPDESILLLPNTFLFGVSTSSYQVEGGWDLGGKAPSIWDDFVHFNGTTPLGHSGWIADHSNGDFADETYDTYVLRADVERMARLGIANYRFSISWPRLLPSGYVNATRADGGANPIAVRYYQTLLAMLAENEIKAHVTLFHWDLPSVLQARLGGWLSPKLPLLFRDYAALCFRLFGSSSAAIASWFTINEPWSIAVGAYYQGGMAPLGAGALGGGNSSSEPYIVAHHLLLAHAHAVDAFRSGGALFAGEIAIVLNSNWWAPDPNATNASHAEELAQRARIFQVGGREERFSLTVI
tara:strand:+ start:79 stop:1008 length:930 start_codon:yes stop_codon:yes gene_type:complete